MVVVVDAHQRRKCHVLQQVEVFDAALVVAQANAFRPTRTITGILEQSFQPANDDVDRLAARLRQSVKLARERLGNRSLQIPTALEQLTDGSDEIVFEHQAPRRRAEIAARSSSNADATVSSSS